MNGATVTLLSTCKPFRGHPGVIQRKAITSWARLRPQAEVILFGDEEGVREIARECGVDHVADVARNEHGTPLVSGIVRQGQARATTPYVCYINADIILMRCFVETISMLAGLLGHRPFLLTGAKWDIETASVPDFDDVDWQRKLRATVASSGSRPDAFEYFVFPRDLEWDMPPFSARPFFDNWFIFTARARGIPVIDASDIIWPVHQRHDHSHYLPDASAVALESPEVRFNLRLLGFWHKYTLVHATHALTARGLEPRRAPVAALGEQVRMVEIYTFYLLRRWRPWSSPLYIAWRSGRAAVRLLMRGSRAALRLLRRGSRPVTHRLRTR